MARILLCSSAVRVPDSQANRKMDVAWGQISRILKLGKKNVPVVPNWFQPCQCCCRLCSADRSVVLALLQVAIFLDSMKLFRFSITSSSCDDCLEQPEPEE